MRIELNSSVLVLMLSETFERKISLVCALYKGVQALKEVVSLVT
jgi:hypothetical protein